MSFTQSIVSHRITKWFHHNDGYGVSPSEWVYIVTERFLDVCTKFNLTICINDNQFYNTLCEAVCVMYHASITHGDWIGPKRKFPMPTYWNDSREQLWCDFIHGRMLTYEFWESFWAGVDEQLWEAKIPNFRINMEYLLPLYIRRSNDVLVEEGELVEQEDGNIVTVEEYENTEESWSHTI